MTVVEDGPVGWAVELQARALLLPDGPAAVISADHRPGDLPSVDLARTFPVLDGWIVDLSLRDERVGIVTETDVLCSAPVFPVPSGWMAAVAARGLLAVVLCAGPGVGRVVAPARAMRGPGILAARIPVCLS